MEPLTLGMQSLRISQFFLENRTPNEDDDRRLGRGLEFLKRILRTMLFLEDGETEGLEEDDTIAFSEARYASDTVVRLQQATDYPEVRSYLECMARQLSNAIERKGNISDSSRDQLQEFFSTIGELMVSEVVDRVPREFDEDYGNTATDLYSNIEEGGRECNVW